MPSQNSQLCHNHVTTESVAIDIPASLYQFFVDSSDLRLPGLHTSCDSSESESSGDWTDKRHGTLSFFGMNRKKSHEVQRLSKVIADTMSNLNLTQVRLRLV